MLKKLKKNKIREEINEKKLFGEIRRKTRFE